MAKPKIHYRCRQCGAVTSKWSGRCLACNSWDSLEEETPILGATKSKSTTTLAPINVHEIVSANKKRYATGNKEVDKVLGGGIVPGSLVLLAGDPGIGKSTLVLQLANLLSSACNVLYVSGEESAEQIKLRADRLGHSHSQLNFIATNDIDAVVAHCETTNYDVVIIDSIQTMFSAQFETSPSGVAQLTNNTNLLARISKQTNTAFIVIGHVTKEGNVAGPRLLEHLVDTVLYLEGERSGGFKLLRSVKNRFGSTREVGIFEMTSDGLVEVANPSAYLLKERQSTAGSIVLATMEGTRPLLVEVQALVAPSVFGYPKRTAVGVDLNRLQLLAAVATKRSNLRLSDKDIYVNIVGGLKVIEPAVDLAIILAIASSLENIIPPTKLAVFGEVGLSGELRGVANAKIRLAEAKQLGYTEIIAPHGVANGLIHQPKNINEAISILKNIAK